MKNATTVSVFFLPILPMKLLILSQWHHWYAKHYALRLQLLLFKCSCFIFAHFTFCIVVYLWLLDVNFVTLLMFVLVVKE